MKKTKDAPLSAAQESKQVASLRAKIQNLHNKKQISNVRNNELQDIVAQMFGGDGTGTPTALNTPFTMAKNNAYTPRTLNRQLLAASYMSDGLVATAINVPVEDAFRQGFTVETKELGPEELEELHAELYAPRAPTTVWTINPVSPAALKVNPQAFTDAGPSYVGQVEYLMKMVRLFGGGALILNTDQVFSTPLKLDKLTRDSPLAFLPTDRWELWSLPLSDPNAPFSWSYYGRSVHRSRVCKVNNNEAPSYVRQMLQGWGLSEIEGSIRAINAFQKFEALMFALLDEARIDVYKVTGFNDSLGAAIGSEKIAYRIALSNQMKNNENALVMDKNDDYSQKLINFAGFADLWQQVAQNLAAYLRLPMNKLFGMSAGGFGSGQDSLENYNSVVGGVQYKATGPIRVVVQALSQKLFGITLSDLKIKWPAMRTLDGVEQEQVLTARQARTMELFVNGFLTDREAAQKLRDDGCVNLDTEVLQGVRAVEPRAQGPDQAVDDLGSSLDKAVKDKRDKRNQERATQKDRRSAPNR